MLNNIITKPARKNFTRQGWNSHSGAFSLQDVAEVFKVGVAASHGAVFEFEGGDVGSTDDFVVGVHVAGGAVGHGVFYFYLQEVFGWTVNFVEGLETSFSHGVHFGGLGGENEGYGLEVWIAL